jgi:hemerythrin superfamily protein
MTDQKIELPRLTSGDVVELILADHRVFEQLLRQLRDSTDDRDAARRTFATLHVAHAEAEEHEVYPTLRKKDAITEGEEDHGEKEHAEGNQALLAVLEAKTLEGESFDELVEELATVVNHHLTEEELTILNPAREEVESEVLHRLGSAFAKERNRLIDEGCGDIENVRAIVAEAQEKGLLGD